MQVKNINFESISVLNSQNVDSDVVGVNHRKDSVIRLLKFKHLENEEKKFEENDETSYQLLPQKYFKSGDLPTPLVSKKWFSSFLSFNCLSDNENSDEDCIPLVHLKTKKERKKKESNEFVSTTKTVVVNRKRGRPKKQLKELTDGVPDSVLFESDEGLNGEGDINFSSDSPRNIDEGNDENGLVSLEEHDYYKTVTRKTPTELESEKEKHEGRKDKVAVKGVKNEDKKMSFPCVECGKSFSAASTLKSHMRIHNNTLHKCSECQKGFTTKYLLKCHSRIHNGDLFMCHKCGKGFMTAELLKVHGRGHTGDRPFVCNICNKSFPSASNMSQHKLTHNSEKKFLCFQCGASFSQKRCLDGHMLTHAEKNHICTVCGKLWARKSDLSEHMRVHTGVKPYCCSICPQKFTQASSLKRHQVVHMNAKPIQCTICNKSFKCQQYYKRHAKKHDKESEYSVKTLPNQ